MGTVITEKFVEIMIKLFVKMVENGTFAIIADKFLDGIEEHYSEDDSIRAFIILAIVTALREIGNIPDNDDEIDPEKVQTC